MNNHRSGQLPPQSKKNELTPNQKPLTLTANSQKTATKEMKLFKMTFAAFGILAAIAIALRAYWHIYTLGMCAVMVYAIRKEERPKNGNR